MKILYHTDDLALPVKLFKTPAYCLLRSPVTKELCCRLIDQHRLRGIAGKVPGETSTCCELDLVLRDIIPIHKIRIEICHLEIMVGIFNLTIRGIILRTGD